MGKCKSGTNPVDGISPNILVIVLQFCLNDIVELFICIISNKQFDKKASRRKIENYRPTSKLPALALIFERVLYKKIKGSIERKLCLNQHGFRKHHSTVANLILYCDIVHKKFQQGELPITLLLDIAKTFDSISHNIILYQLAKTSFDHEFLQFFASYLTNRKQIVFSRNTLSHSRNILSGSPHGSIFAVFLFSSYINDMPEIIDNPSFLYAENTKIFGNWFDLSSIRTDLNNGITGATETELTSILRKLNK